MQNVVIADNEFNQAAKAAQQEVSLLEDSADRLIACIEQLSVSGIVSASTTAALSEKAFEIRDALNNTFLYAEPLVSKTNNHVDTVDEIDQYLY
jgi:hypothetical protein